MTLQSPDHIQFFIFESTSYLQTPLVYHALSPPIIRMRGILVFDHASPLHHFYAVTTSHLNASLNCFECTSSPPHHGFIAMDTSRRRRRRRHCRRSCRRCRCCCCQYPCRLLQCCHYLLKKTPPSHPSSPTLKTPILPPAPARILLSSITPLW